MTSSSSGYEYMDIDEDDSSTQVQSVAFFSNAHRLAYDSEESESEDMYDDTRFQEHFARSPVTIPSGRSMKSLRTVAKRWGISHEEAAELMQNVEDAIATPSSSTTKSASTSTSVSKSKSKSKSKSISNLTSTQSISSDKIKVQKTSSLNFLQMDRFPTIDWFFQRCTSR
eukprot:m.96305 g.96305  ORF g.96305 m.96305 type:complete len:170 (+) comp26886_c0_seq1:318-827(+)